MQSLLGVVPMIRGGSSRVFPIWATKSLRSTHPTLPRGLNPNLLNPYLGGVRPILDERSIIRMRARDSGYPDGFPCHLSPDSTGHAYTFRCRFS